MANHRKRVPSDVRGTIMLNTKNMNKPVFFSQQGLPIKAEMYIDNKNNI